MLRSLFTGCLLAIFMLGAAGCALIESKPDRNYDTISAGPVRDSAKAAELNQEAIDAFQAGHLTDARSAVDEALIADVNYGAAHNTLGRIYHQQGNYYLAAWEFEFAIRLQPNRAEYHNNLGLVYEAVDRFPEAIEAFQLAASLAPDNFHFNSNLVRARIRSGEQSIQTRQLLERLVMMDPRQDWKDWARLQLNTSHLDIPSVTDTGFATFSSTPLEENSETSAVVPVPLSNNSSRSADSKVHGPQPIPVLPPTQQE